ncbi:alpha/beta hydrolase [Kineosporia sp. NBRC 101731]|uniref:alpha/beta fold hydrolase n=1 Tax=Kineosporia sp. NBRC 101731 TaxID=3032199 RepID=UPI0024A00B22|nr:alpha/beta hydrolase [Kineosporia sp. NBRC 101731]GLY29635.1 alpha/beta hydrolase [Kineosporia sp. NBRC 101731]
MKLAVKEWGSGSRRALLIHGATSTKEWMTPLAEVLVDRGYRVLAPDLRGHGDSPRGDHYALQALADDVVETIGEPVELAIGHSLGGKVLPGAVRDLKVERALYLDPAWTAREVDPYAQALTKPDGSPMNRDDLKVLYPGLSEAARQETLARYLAMDWRLFHDPLLQLRRTTMPAIPAATRSLVVLADPSVLVPPVMAEALRVGGYEVRTQKGSNHGLFQSDMPEFLATVEGWL